MSPVTDTMFRAERSSIAKHWGLLRSQLSGVLPKVGGGYSIDTSSVVSPGVVGDLVCQRYRYEKVLRDRGGDIPVVPLIDPEDEVKYWLGLRQIWREAPNPLSKRLHCGTTSIAVFFGKENPQSKVQLFRAEWPGLRQLPDGTLVFDAPGAGHPHWHFDIYQEPVSEAQDEERIAEIEKALSGDFALEDFADTMNRSGSFEEEVERASHLKRLAKIHFASYAQWAESPWMGDMTQTGMHAKSPTDLAEIMNWIVSTLAYIQREILR